LSLACFTVLALLHIAALSVFNFVETGEKSPAGIKELFFTLDFADQAYEEQALPAAPLPREAVSPEIPEAVPVLAEETAAVSQIQEETALPQAASLSAPEASGGIEAGTGLTSGGSAVSSGPVGYARTMSDAEYLALIMSRLEQHKIYPLTLRRRGIEGNVTVAFTIGRNGTVSDIQLADPSGHRFLAQAAFETIRSSGPFPVMEGRDRDYKVQITIRYQLEDGINPNN
jgi:TonB family protein